MNIFYSRSLREFCRDFRPFKYDQPVQGHPQKSAADSHVRHRQKGRHGDGHVVGGRNSESRAAGSKTPRANSSKTRLPWLHVGGCRARRAAENSSQKKRGRWPVRLETSTPGPEQARLDCLDGDGNGKQRWHGAPRPWRQRRRRNMGEAPHATLEEKKEEGKRRRFCPSSPATSIHDVTGMTVLRARQFFRGSSSWGAEGTLGRRAHRQGNQKKPPDVF